MCTCFLQTYLPNTSLLDVEDKADRRIDNSIPLLQPTRRSSKLAAAQPIKSSNEQHNPIPLDVALQFALLRLCYVFPVIRPVLSEEAAGHPAELLPQQAQRCQTSTGAAACGGRGRGWNKEDADAHTEIYICTHTHGSIFEQCSADEGIEVKRRTAVGEEEGVAAVYHIRLPPVAAALYWQCPSVCLTCFSLLLLSLSVTAVS
jgi:hypothetical protein